MIIFESILTSFKLSIIIRGSWGGSVNWLKPEIKPPKTTLVCPNPQNALQNVNEIVTWMYETTKVAEMFILMIMAQTVMMGLRAGS
jgi:hypothetical protein